MKKLILAVVLVAATKASAYQYVSNNPVNLVDPLGLQSVNGFPGPAYFQGLAAQQQARQAPAVPGIVFTYQEMHADRSFYQQDPFYGDRRNDTARHIAMAYEGALEHGEGMARCAGAVNEIQGAILLDLPRLIPRIRDNGPWAFELSDFMRNEIGFSLANALGPSLLGPNGHVDPVKLNGVINLPAADNAARD